MFKESLNVFYHSEQNLSLSKAWIVPLSYKEEQGIGERKNSAFIVQEGK